jgi:NADH-ubiquinone oxidoreductase chain 4L
MMGINLYILFIIMIKICKLIKIKGSYFNHLCYNLRPYFLNYLDKKDTMNLSLILFLIGILGFVLNRKNIILMLISIEIMLLAITFLILISSLSFDDILGQTYAIYIIAIAGAESAIGLGILVAFYRLRGSISIEYK